MRAVHTCEINMAGEGLSHLSRSLCGCLGKACYRQRRPQAPGFEGYVSVTQLRLELWQSE